MTGIKRSSKQILPMVIGSTLVLGLIWLNTFIHQNSFSDSYGDFSFLIEIIQNRQRRLKEVHKMFTFQAGQNRVFAA